MLRGIICLLCTMLSYGVELKHKEIADKRASARFIEINEGQLYCNESLLVVDERYRGVVRLAMEAHEKNKFSDGVIYVNNGDGDSHKQDLHDSHMYYTAFLASKGEFYRQHAGPDYSCHAWPSAKIFSFNEAIGQIVEASAKKPLTAKVGWVGNMNMARIRFNLVSLSNDNPEIFDFKHFANGDISVNASSFITLPQLVENNAYLLDIQGQGYSGRLKYLLYSNRPLFHVERDYVEYYNHELQPMVHYIPIKSDLSNLISQYKWAIENADKAKEIAQNALDFAEANLNHDKFIEKLSETFRYILSQPTS